MSPTWRRVQQLLLLTAVQGLLLLGSAGTLAWPAAWVYLALYVALLVAGGIALLPHGGEVIAERSKGTAGGKPWDLVITRLVGVSSLAVLVVAGLAVRWAWRPQFAIGWQVLGAALFCAGFAVVLWAMRVNRFFSQVVRIQSERGHVAITTGPYRFVRHPGYAGMLTSIIGAVLLLGSPWAAIPMACYMAVMLVRTALEDSTLRRELPGYLEYSHQTRFRLVPGVF